MQTSFACGKGFAPAPLSDPTWSPRLDSLDLAKAKSMAPHRWDSDLKDRYIYLLVFAGQRVYVGQSVNPVRRIKAHRRPSGGWSAPFLPLIVYRIYGTEADGVDLEYAWRWCAYLNGWNPIDSKGTLFNKAEFREDARQQGEELPWPFTT